MKYILVTGGVCSGIGKGVVSSSIGAILKGCGVEVTCIKIDPYYNEDAGLMSPIEHGEVFVLDDGGEVDLDLGNYERFLDITLTRDHNITKGKIVRAVTDRERRGDYLGKTVQEVPHVIKTIQEWIERVAKVPVSETGKTPEVCIIELGGTIGDIDSRVLVEALGNFRFRSKPEDFCVVHVSLVIELGATGEQKTKPTQHSVIELRALGLQPHIIICRTNAKPINKSSREKISNFCHVPVEQIISIPNLDSIYGVPVLMESQGMASYLRNHLKLNIKNISSCTKKWIDLSKSGRNLKDEVNVALVCKYARLEDSTLEDEPLKDAYTSVIKALSHAAIQFCFKVNVTFIDACALEKEPSTEEPAWQQLRECDCVVVPGGFGKRGVEGKINASKWCRENKKPFLGICLGFQTAVIEFARNVLELKDANSVECEEKPEHPVIIDMPEHNTGVMGGTMRLGKRVTVFKSDTESEMKRLYGNKERIEERHRHRYEVNPSYVEALEKGGLSFVGVDEEKKRMEILELPSHPFYVAVQFHPEYLSRPMNPSPPFKGLLLTAHLARLRRIKPSGCALSLEELQPNNYDSDGLTGHKNFENMEKDSSEDLTILQNENDDSKVSHTLQAMKQPTITTADVLFGELVARELSERKDEEKRRLLKKKILELLYSGEYCYMHRDII